MNSNLFLSEQKNTHMKKLQSICLLLSVLTLFSLAACKKEPKEKSRAELINKTWKVRKADHNNTIVFTDPEGTQPNTVNYKAYRLKFSGSTLTIIDNNGNEASGPWKFSADEKQIIFNPGTANERTFNITSISDSSMNISFDEPQKDGTLSIKLEFVPVQ